MRCLLFATLLLAAPLGAFALTWDFDGGTTWGWTAQESFLGDDKRSPTTVYSEVEDGVWRIAPVPGGQRPAIQLRSPPIGEDSALFDYITLRLRIIHDRPTEGNLLMDWFNTEYRRLRNVLGQPMRHVWTGPLPAGEHQLTWDGRDAQGRPVAAGVYLYRLHVGDQTRTHKMVKLE